MKRQHVPRVALVLAGLTLTISFLTTASAAPGDSAEVYLSKGGMALKSHQYDKAIENLSAALRIDSVNVTALRNLGAAYAAKGNNPQARVYLEKANQLKPNDPEICNNLGVIFSNLDNPSEAIRYFEAAVAADSTSAMFLTSLGNEHLKIGRVQKALPILQKAHKLAPTNPIPAFSIGSCFAADKKYDSAAVYYERSILAGGKTPELFYFLGIAKRQLGDFEAAEKNYKLAVEQNPNYKECLQALGLLSAQREKYVAAQAYFEKVIALDSLFYPAWISLGATSWLTNQFARADTILYNLLQKDSTLGYQMLRLIEMEKRKRDNRQAVDSAAKATKK
jgi:tetratricopeptide (TPR) repeat protein